MRFFQKLETQIKQIQQFIDQKVDVLIISPNQSDSITPIAVEAYRKGIPTIIVDRKIGSEEYTAYVGGDSYEIGRIAGEYASAFLPENATIAEVWGTKLSSPAQERHLGFINGLKKKNVNIKTVVGNWRREIAKKEVSQLEDFNDIDLVCIMSVNPGFGGQSFIENTYNKVTKLKDLIIQKSLLDGQTHLFKVEKMIELKKEFDLISPENRNNWCWLNSYNNQFAKFRNELIGTLCSDLSQGMDLNTACQTWNKRVDPANYMKASAPITKRQIEEAQKFVEENVGTEIETSIYGALLSNYFDAKNVEGIKKYSQKLIDLKDESYRYEMGYAYYLEKNYSEATKNFLIAKKFPNFTENSLYYLGMVEKEKGNMKEAKAYFLQVYKKDKYYSVDLLNELKAIYEKEGNTVEIKRIQGYIDEINNSNDDTDY